MERDGDKRQITEKNSQLSYEMRRIFENWRQQDVQWNPH
jgi:hypothetical protein